MRREPSISKRQAGASSDYPAGRESPPFTKQLYPGGRGHGNPNRGCSGDIVNGLVTMTVLLGAALGGGPDAGLYRGNGLVGKSGG